MTRKITRAVAAIELGMQPEIFLGNLDAKRDWGHARDYVEGMWRIVQHEKGDDWVLATGETHTVREFVERAFSEINRTIVWSGEGVDEIGKDEKTGDVPVRIDPRYFRPTEVELLIGDASKAKAKLGWTHTTTFPELVKEMVASDLEIVKDETRRKNRHD